MNNSKWMVATLAALVGMARLQAQTLTTGTGSDSASPSPEPLVMNTSDMATVKTLSNAELAAFVSALDATPQISYDALPDRAAGTFYSLQNPDWPPLPGDVNGLPVWPMNGFYLLNDVYFDYPAAARTTTLSSSSTVQTLDSIDPTDPGDGGTNTYEPGYTYTAPDYGTNLWLAQVTLTNGYLTYIASNTVAGVLYEVQTNADIATTNWGTYIPYSFFHGSDDTNWTPLDAVLIDPTATNIFFRLKSWAADASSLPIWWQLQYFGTNGIDPFGNPAGDGFDNYYKFVHGLNPNQFYTPAAPGGLRVSYYPANQQAGVQWQPGAGLITGYQVEKTYEGHGGNFDVVFSTNDFNVAPDDFSLDDDVSAETSSDDFVYDAFNDFYKVRAQYANGQYSDWSAKQPLKPSLLSASLIYGANEQVYLAVSGVPAGTANIRLFYQDYDAIQYSEPPINFSNDIPYASFSNGLYALPDALQPPAQDTYGLANWGYDVFVQTVNASNVPAGYCWIYEGNGWKKPFHDGRVQLKQNLIFKLRAADVDKPFKFYYNAGGNAFYDYFDEFYNPPTNHVESSLLHITDDVYPYDYTASHGTLMDPQYPFFENCLYYNFVYSLTNVDSAGLLNTGAGNYTTDNVNYDLGLSSTPAWTFQAPSGTWTNVAGLLDASSTGWICSIPLETPANNYIRSVFSTYYENAITFSSTSESDTYALASGAANLYGLPISAEKLALDSVYSGALDINIASGSSYDFTDYYANGPVLYAGTAQPELQTVEYDFWSARPIWNEALDRYVEDWLPGSHYFSPTNQSQTFFVPVGGSVQIAGYAKLAVQNGYAGVYAYLGQYFDQAYQVDTNGAVTANPTGVLSPYGNFFATEAGRAALVTMPDVDTGQRGTNVVYCVALQVDKNHDGEMDSTFSGPDTTSQASPMVCWVNNGYMVAGTGGDLDRDYEIPQGHPEYANYLQGKVTCQRDLENFFRLWIRGLPQLPSSQNYAVTLSMTALRGTPAINLYMSSDSLGGTGYLTDTNVAAEQARTYLSPNPEFGVALATIDSQHSYTLPANFFDDNYPYYSRFLFEGAGIGLGQLTLTLTQSSNVLCQTSVYLDLHDIKDMYEVADATNVTSGLPPSSLISQCRIDRVIGTAPDETKQVIVFVHGINNTEFEAQNSTELIYKRLYWSGYHGKVVEFKWPCAFLPNSMIDPSEYLKAFNYDKGEFYAWKSAAALKDYLCYLTNRLTGYQIDILAHSQGNIVASEALEQGAPFDNYILTQAAVPAHCYDTSLPFQQKFLDAETNSATPLYPANGGYYGYFANLTGNLINFYNTNDYALRTGNLLGLYDVNWEQDQISQKPEDYSYTFGQHYWYDGTNCERTTYYFITTDVTDLQEARAMVARSRSHALGAQENVGGDISSFVDLNSSFGFGKSREEHSAQFAWPIQRSLGYYQLILNRIQPAQ